MSRDRGRLARGLGRLVEAVLPGPVARALLRDLDEGFRARHARDPEGARRWLQRQLLLTLRPGNVRDLRRLQAPLSAHRPGIAARLLTGLGADLRYAVRLLASSPGFSAVTVIVLAGGLGVSIFTFSLLYGAIYAPLPLPDADGVVRVLGVRDGRSGWLDAVDVAALRRDSDSFETLGAWQNRYVVLRGGTESHGVSATVVDPNMFQVADVAPVRGRRLVPADAAPGATPVAVLGHSLWQATFGGDPGVVGRRVRIDDVPTRIVGVMPEGFGFPVAARLWLPLPEAALDPAARGTRFLSVYGELRPGVSPEQADAALHARVQRLRAEALEADPDAAGADLLDTAVVRTFQKAQLGDEAGLISVVLHLAAGFILLLACVNAGNILLARGLERGREIDVRVALGAPRLRLLTQMMAEGALVTVLAGALATAGAGVALEIFDAGARATFPEGLAYWWRWGLDAPTLAAAAALVLATVALVGGVPAWRVIGAEGDGVLHDDRKRGRRLHGDRVSRGLVALQVTLISVLLFLGGMTSILTLRATDLDLGLDPEGVMVGIVDLGSVENLSPEGRLPLLDRVTERLAADPAVEDVILRAELGSSPLAVEGREYVDEASQPRARLRATLGDPGIIGVRVRAGRRFDARDVEGAEPVALVSESLARELWEAESPLGRRVRIGSVDGEAPWRTVVGVLSDVVEGNPLSRDRHRRTIYVPLRQRVPARVAVTFGHRGDVRAAVTALHEALAVVDPSIVPERVMDLDEMVGVMQRMAGNLARVLAGCFGFALLLALGGIYGLAGRSASQRIHEIGIRRALGATTRSVVASFLGVGGRQLAIGLALAAAIVTPLSIALTRFLVLEPALFVAAGAAVVVTVSGLVLTATYVPTRRAVSVPPREAIWGR